MRSQWQSHDIVFWTPTTLRHGPIDVVLVHFNRTTLQPSHTQVLVSLIFYSPSAHLYQINEIARRTLQCTQFCALMTSSDFSSNSYTPAGQKRCSGPANSLSDSCGASANCSFTRKCEGWSSCDVALYCVRERKGEMYNNNNNNKKTTWWR